MGMAASQVRFLSLQHRKNSIGRQLSTLSNRKMSLSRDMNQVSRNYTNALNQINLKWSNDCGNTYHGLSYDMLMKPNDVNAETPYILTNARNGKVILNDTALYDQDGNKIMTGEWSNVGGQNFPAGELSYLRIAQMISSFTGISDDGEEIYCNNTNAYAKNEDGNWVGKANPGAYYIPANDEFSFDNNLRMKIFMLMGLVTQDQIDTQNSLLTELYGSQEAKETGVYPVGTAWGDYYIALAQLEAYENYVNTDQAFAVGNLLDNTGTNVMTDYKYTHGDYSYSADADGKFSEGKSVVTQKNIGTGALAHVDFSSVVDKDAISGLYETKNSGSVASTYFDKYTTSNTLNDGLYLVSSVVSPAGLQSTYETNDILASALIAMKEIDSTAFEGADGSKNATEQTEWDTLKSLSNGGSIILSDWSGKKAFVMDGFNETDGEADVLRILGNFSKIIKNQTVMNIDSELFDSILTKAEAATCATAVNNRMDKYIGSNNSEDDIKDAAKGFASNNAIGCAKKGWYLFRPWNGTAVYINTKILFDMYMSYVSYYMRNPEAPTDAITAINQGVKINTNASTDADGNEIPDNTIYKTIGGSVYEHQFLSGATTDGTAGFVLNRTKLTTTKASDDLSAVYNDGTNSYYYSDDNAQISVFGSYSIDASNNITYNLVAKNIDINADNQNKDVYGVMQKGDKLYYFTDKNKLQTYLTSGTLNGGYIEIDASEQEIGSKIELINEENNFVVIDSTSKTNQKNLSKFAVTANGEPVADPAYRKKLEDAVVKAKERIETLEADINEFYSDSDKKIMDYYDAIFLRIAEQGWEQDEYTKNDAYLNNKIQNNDFFLTECLQKNSSTGFRYTAKQATNISKIFSVHDTNAEQEALVEYESEKRRLQYKENAIDTRMRILETEQEAINTEMESVQKVCNENISKYFKIFA